LGLGERPSPQPPPSPIIFFFLFFSFLFTRTNSLDVRQIASAFLSLPTQTKEKQPHDLPKATAPGIIDEGPPQM
jgi:hypothetical protein